MKKFVFIFLLILILPIISVSVFRFQEYQYIPTPADSGFDSDYGDYDSGGSWGDDWGGGSSWDDSDNDYDYNYSSNGDYSGEPISLGTLFIILIITAIPFVIIFIIKKTTEKIEKQKRKRLAVTKRINEVLFYDFNMQPGYGLKSETIRTAFKNYVEIQKAWMSRDLTPVKHLLTDEMYNMYQMQIETLIEDNQINVMSNFALVCGEIVSSKVKNNIETINVILCVNCKDYIKSANSNKVINGDKDATITYIYKLTFHRDINPNKTINCPTCGSQIKNQMSATCPYCNNALLLTPSELTMSNKKILHQFKRK